MTGVVADRMAVGNGERMVGMKGGDCQGAIEHDVTAAEARSPYTSEASAPAVPAAPQPDEHADTRNQ
jgi:hypothetical protein